MEQPNLQLIAPYTMIVSGQTGSGKTYFVNKLLEAQAKMHQQPFERVVYAYSMEQPLYSSMQSHIPGIEFSLGLPEDFMTSVSSPTLLVLDDLMMELQNDKRLAVLFTKMRHSNLSTIFLVQNLYFKSQYATTVTRNAQYMVLFPNLRDAAMISTLGRQIFPRYRNFLESAFEDATTKRYGYIFLDLKAETDNKLRVRSNIFPGEEPVIYRPA
jgi:hypothetical protein